MSNKSPIASSPCGVCAGWVRCKIKSAACWVQERLEFLCERDKSAPLTPLERYLLVQDWTRFHAEFKAQVISERCTKADYSSRAAFADWLQCAQDHGFVATAEVQTIMLGRISLMNKFGLLPTAGLTCMCCAGYRVWAALGVGFIVGWLI